MGFDFTAFIAPQKCYSRFAFSRTRGPSAIFGDEFDGCFLERQTMRS